jgi:outer membrane protein
MKLLKLSIIIFFVLAWSFSLQAQEKWSLTKCVDYALEHNIQVKQTTLRAESGKANLQQSKAAIYPDLNASASDAFQFGRSVDPYTNIFTDQNVQSLSLSLNSRVTLFNGLQQYNTMDQNNFTYLSYLQEVDEVKNSISLQVATAYLQILFDKELLEVSRRQKEITQEQVNRTKILVEAGSLAKGNLLEIQAQLANEEVAFITAENNIKTSYLNLTQLLELDSVPDFEIDVPEIDDPSEELILEPVGDIFNKSTNLPRIQKEEYNLQSSESALKVAKGGYYPTLYLQASYGTGYSSARSKYSTEQGDEMQIGWVESTSESVVTQGFNTITNPYYFGDQLVDNRSLSFIVGINIPIFNNLQVKTRVTNSKLNLENSKYQLDLAKNNLYKEIQQARNSSIAALATFKASKKAVDAQQESFSYTKQKFDLGLVNSVDYNTAKNQLTKSESDMVQAKYDFIFRVNILNFYQGIPFQL